MTPANPALRALVVEDDPQVRLAVAAILQLHGFEVSTSAAPVAETLEAVRAGHPDVLVLDVALAGIEGLAAISQLRAAAPDAVIVLLTGLDGLRDAALASGAAHVISLTDLRHLTECVQHLGLSTACDCCLVTDEDSTTTPALSSGWFRLTSGPALPVRINHPGDEPATTSSRAPRHPVE